MHVIYEDFGCLVAVFVSTEKTWSTPSLTGSINICRWNAVSLAYTRHIFFTFYNGNHLSTVATTIGS